MELVYLWVKEYKNIKNQGFNFSPRFECEFFPKYDKDGKLKDNCELKITPKDYVSIFPDNINITAIVGENGTGKSRLLCAILDNVNEHNISDDYKLVKNLEIKTCPYCNRSYISFVKNDDKKTRPQLDHFYPKAIYPFLACSFYNLIPSCSACNHMKSDDDSYKDEKDGKLVHPYNVKDSDFTFSYTFNNLDILKSIDEKNIKFEDEEKIKITLDRKYEKNNEYFQLETIYQNHKDIVIELILKEINYPRSYINELIKNSFGTEEEIYRFIFSNYLKIDDLHKRPLSKLTRDIVEELGILYKIELATKEEYSTKEQEN